MSSTLLWLSLLTAGTPSTEILWDRWGVPHIYGATEAELFRGFGYAQMRSHGNLLLKLYGQARGRGAEYWGKSFLTEDIYVRTMGIPSRAAQWFQQQDQGFRANLDAFAEGVNQFAREHPDQLADSLKVVLPITAVDVIAHTQRVIHFSFVHGIERIESLISGGSNTWAIGPSRSASKHAMLLANPHLPWSDFLLFYEAHLVGAGVDLYGSTLVGFPVIAIGFNPNLGWSHTVNTYDGSDLYRLTAAEGGYRWNGAVKPFDQSRETVRVKSGDRSLRDTVLVLRKSIHGPVVTSKSGELFAARVAGLDQPGMLSQWWAMGKAHNLGEFETALRTLQVPMFNVMYADRDGHILYLFGGRVPERSCCDVAYWAGIVPGDSSGNLWTRTLSYEQLPRLVDPPNGWLQNANDPPWTSTIPIALTPERFPAWLSPKFMHFRAQRSAHMLMQDSSITFDELVAYKHSTRMELADRLLDPLLAAARASRNAPAQEAAEVLAQWDRQANADSKGAILFTAWADRVTGDPKLRSRLFALPWTLDSPSTTPRGLANPTEAVAMLAEAAASIKSKFGRLDIPWGEVKRIRYGGRDLPGNGADGDPFGVFRVAGYSPTPDGKSQLLFGDTFYAAVEFGPTVRAKVLLAYGNSTQPGSAHLGDQLELFAKQQMRDAWRTRQEIEANLELKESLGTTTKY